MSLTPGTRLGPYEILTPLGAGGMGEVYRAHDATLGRDVAIKILPAAVATDPDRLARFAREAKTLASLNHPHIAQVYGFEHAGDTRALVMELVEGEDLSQRLTRGALPIDEALPIARQMAEALEAAHEQGIIHRDLKPANVKVRSDGTVKVLDFGLAKALDATRLRQGYGGQAGDAMADDPLHSPTFTRPAAMTEMGVILGTASYMAPEQARGKSVDKRADVWAFGCVLYELVSGRRAYDGESTTDILARLIERDPDWNALPAATPDAIRRLLARCLTKDPKSRLRDIGEARVVIEEIVAGRSSPSSAAVIRSAALPPSAAWRLLPWALAAVFALATFVVWFRSPAPPAPGRPIRVELDLPADIEFFSGPSLSSDGMRLAFIGVRQGIRQIYLRSLDDEETRALAGTETASNVAMAPDGGAAVFVTTETRLKRIVFSTGIVDTLTDGAWIYSAPAWLRDGSIVFSRGDRIVLRPGDGPERDLAMIDTGAGEVSLGWPLATGDNHILFVCRRTGPTGLESRLEAVASGGGPRQLVRDNVDQPVYAGGGRLVFDRGGVLYMAGLTAARESRGALVRLGDQILIGQIGGLAASVADSGTLAAAPPSVVGSHLVWVSTAGGARDLTGAPRGFLNPRLSPDGRLIAFSEAGTIWTLDPERSSFTRVSEGSAPTIGFPVWAPDSRRIYYRSSEGIRFRSADGEGASTVLANTGTNDYPNSMSADGSTLILARVSPATGADLYATPAGGGELKPLLITRAYEGGAQISPDGKWLLYVSDESGRMDVYLRPIGGPDRKWAVSSAGGIHALWSPDGRRIFYRSGNALLAVDVQTTPDIRLSPPKVLFEGRFAFGQNLTTANYSLSADGREFLMVQEARGGRHLTLVLNWLQALGPSPP